MELPALEQCDAGEQLRAEERRPNNSIKIRLMLSLMIGRYESAMPQEAAGLARDLLQQLHSTEKTCEISDKLMVSC